ncbi:MurR/RpiR family transcriptional regulator [Marinitenerispora sediminis]|uniref:MurR/RpiR family transcriptional regulator n=1 Tax=Marinitenerispora sediminis TaxID=1931232 RepID=UPI0018F20AF8|nr:MurR/RpiR family transcriptional regulator [Marinitenerispora sediminis]
MTKPDGTPGTPHPPLSPALTRVADTLAANPELGSHGQVAEVARAAGVNPSTVVRYAQALGYNGWPALQQELRATYLAGLNASETLRRHNGEEPAGAVHRALRRDLANLRAALDTVDPEAADAAIEAIHTATRTLVVASGSYVAPAHLLAHLGPTMGLPITLESRGGVHLATALSGIGPGDCVVAVSFWRQTRDTLLAARIAAEAGATVVAVTDANTGVAAHARHVLKVPSEGLSFFQSTTAAVSVVYGLLAGLGARRGPGADAALRRTEELWEALGALGTPGTSPGTAR